MRSATRRILRDLSPDEFGWIKFRCRRRKLVHMQTRMMSQEILDLAATMNRVLVPDHHDRPRITPKQMLQKADDLIAAQRDRIGLQMQFDLAFSGTEADGTDQVETFIVFDTCANDRRFTARRPCPFERRNQRKATFIKKNKRCAESLPLFLYGARRTVSNAQSPRRRDATHAVAVVDNSTRAGA